MYLFIHVLICVFFLFTLFFSGEVVISVSILCILFHFFIYFIHSFTYLYFCILFTLFYFIYLFIFYLFIYLFIYFIYLFFF